MPAIARATPQEPRTTPPPADDELDAGTDPSKSSRRVNLYHEYYKIENGFSFNTTTLQVTLPILAGGGTLGFTMPFTYAELPQVRPFGLGDVSARIVLLPTQWASLKPRWRHPAVTPIVGAEVYLPTADSTLRVDPASNRLTTLTLGTGKYRVNVLGGVAWVPRKGWLVIPLYGQEQSFAGDPAFDDVNQGKFRLFIQYQHPSGLYCKPEFQWVIDFTDDRRLDVYIAPEVGQVLRGGTVFYVKPGVGVVNEANNRNWGVELGIRQKF